MRGELVETDELELHDQIYPTGGSEEHFLSFNTSEDRLAGFLRLSLPSSAGPAHGLQDLDRAAIVREVHVYGQSLEVGEDTPGIAQHSGLGTRLMFEAEDIARTHGFTKIAVIAALGTRGYYRRLGYELGATYMVKTI